MDTNKILKYVPYIVGGIVVYKLLQKLGLIPDKNDTLVEGVIQDPGNVFTKTQVKKGDELLNSVELENNYKKIVNAKGIPYLTNDDEDMVYSVFRNLKNASQLNQLTDYFISKKNVDILTYLDSFLSNDELAVVINISKRLK